MSTREKKKTHFTFMFLTWQAFGKNTVIIPLDGDRPLDAVEHLPSRFHHAFKVVVVDTTFLVSFSCKAVGYFFLLSSSKSIFSLFRRTSCL